MASASAAAGAARPAEAAATTVSPRPSLSSLISGPLAAAAAVSLRCTQRPSVGGSSGGSTSAGASSPGGFSSVPSSPQAAFIALEADDAAGGSALLGPLQEERVEELVQGGQTRRDALRQVARENMGAEVREGLQETFSAGALPGSAGSSRICGTLCHALMVLFILVLLLPCAFVCASCVALKLAGWFVTWWLLACGHQKELRAWLFLYQMVALVEAVVCHLMRGCVQRVQESLDARVGAGFARACALGYAALSFSLKILWCVHVQVVAARYSQGGGAEKGECGSWFPRFMSVYSGILLMQLLIVEPAIRAGMGLALGAATRGLLTTSRGAKPGTLEAMQVVEFEKDLFADPSDPGDRRPQGECCVCLEEYDSESVIVRTPCRHFMHKDCLAKWLQTSHFCPICRGNLEEEAAEQDVESPLMSGAA